MLAILIVALLPVTASVLLAQESARPSAPEPRADDLTPDPAEDEPGLLDLDQVEGLAAVARRLSASDAWLSEETVAAFEERGNLYLHELFARAQTHVSFEGRLYRISLELTDRTASSETGGPPVIYLNHEVFNGLGPSRALAYQEGEEIVLHAHQLDDVRAIGLTLVEETRRAVRISPESVPAVTEELELGRLRRDPLPRAVPAPRLLDLATSCSPEWQPTCSNGQMACSDGSTPFFVFTELMIESDKEGCCFKGKPEIQLFPLRLPASGTFGGSTDVRTDWIFCGDSVTDLAGRSRSLPNIDSTGVWYDIDGGLAVFPMEGGKRWSALLSEDDGDQGQLNVDPTTVNVTDVFTTAQSIIQDIREMQYLELLRDLYNLIDILGLLNDDDEIYQNALGITEELFCADAAGQAFPHTFTFDPGNWRARGYFACIDASCTPTEPDPTCLEEGEFCSSSTLPCCPDTTCVETIDGFSQCTAEGTAPTTDEP